MDYIADTHTWLKQHDSIGWSSGTFPALACPGTSPARNDIWPARRHISSASVLLERRIAIMVAKIRDQMCKEVLEYASHNVSHLYYDSKEIAVGSYCKQLYILVLVICLELAQE